MRPQSSVHGRLSSMKMRCRAGAASAGSARRPHVRAHVRDRFRAAAEVHAWRCRSTCRSTPRKQRNCFRGGEQSEHVASEVCASTCAPPRRAEDCRSMLPDDLVLRTFFGIPAATGGGAVRTTATAAGLPREGLVTGQAWGGWARAWARA